MLEGYEKFKDEYGYIIDIDKLIDYLSDLGMTTKEITNCLISVSEYNLKIYKKIEEDNRLQEQMSKLNHSISLIETKKKQSGYDKYDGYEECITNKDKIDISYYIFLLNELAKEKYSSEDIIDILPSKLDPDFHNIINAILLHYRKELVELLSLKEKNDKEFVEYIKEEKEVIISLSKTIINYRNSKEEIATEDKKMNILFDPLLYESDIHIISMEHYHDFYVLLKNLEKNILRGVKTFTPNGRNKAVSEVRYNGARILFDKIDNETYFAYYIFHKKDNDKYYHEKLIKRANHYSNNKKEFLERFYNALEKEDFLDENKNYYNNAINILFNNKAKEGEDSGNIKKRIK